jgi:hypothetical protein
MADKLPQGFTIDQPTDGRCNLPDVSQRPHQCAAGEVMAERLPKGFTIDPPAGGTGLETI